MPRIELTHGWRIELTGPAEREENRADGVLLVWDSALSVEFLIGDESAVHAADSRDPALALDADGVVGGARIDTHTEDDGSFSGALSGVATSEGQTVLLRICFLDATLEAAAIEAWRSVKRTAA